MTPHELETIGRSVVTFTRGLVAGLEARLAAVEARAAVPGPPGAPGAPGATGAPGERGPAGPAGADGLGLEDFSAEFVGGRTLRLALTRGDRTVTRDVTLTGFPDVDPDDLAWRPDRTYQRGDIVQLNGAWIAKGTSINMRPGSSVEAAACWKLFLKAGRDGKDARR